MAKVFIGIALVFMLVTAGVGYALKGRVDTLQTTLTSTKSRVASAEASAKTAKKEADDAKTAKKEADDKAEAATQTAAAKTKEAADATAAIAEKTQLVESLTAKNTDLQKQLEDAKNKPVAPNGPTPEQVTELQTQVQNLTKEKEEVKVTLDSEVAKAKENDEKVRELSKKLRDREMNYQKPGLQGRVLAVNSGWNFVVLSVGDKQGVVINATLLVVRGNEPIARLRVTSVEPSTSIADVLPGTVRRGTAVQPGDTVIFEGTRNQVPQGPKSSPEAPTVPPITPPAPALPNN